LAPPEGSDTSRNLVWVLGPHLFIKIKLLLIFGMVDGFQAPEKSNCGKASHRSAIAVIEFSFDCHGGQC
jgi:hypothetical protein